MQKLIKAFEDVMVAVTFAESGEYDEARKINASENEAESVVSQHAGSKAAVKA